MNSTPKEPSGDWTPRLVLEHLLGIIAAHDVRYTEAFAAIEKAAVTASIASGNATAAAFSASEKAIRDALAAVEKSTASTFVAGEKAVVLAESNAERWREDAASERRRVTEREGNLATKTEVQALKERLDRWEGTGRGARETYAWLSAAAMAAVAIATLLVSVMKK